MNQKNKDILKVLKSGYKEGFSTEIAAVKAPKGITEAVVRFISEQKKEPDWLLDFRLKAFRQLQKMSEPHWLKGEYDPIDYQDLYYYSAPDSKKKPKSLDEIDPKIRETYQKLGIPLKEQEALAGVAIDAVFDSVSVATTYSKALKEKGILFCPISEAVREYPELVKEYFTKCVPLTEHKFIALHYAVWSGGSFVYIPKGVKLEMPLQSYFRLNSPESGQFEHTLIIVDEGASLHFIEGCSAPKYNKVNLHAGCVELFVKENGYLRYSTIENWSKNMLNLNTKKAICEKNAQIDWVSGSFGSKISMLYPMSILKGDNSKTEYTGISFAGKGQNLDTGFKVVHIGKNTSSLVNSRSISKNGGIATYRSLVKILPSAENSRCSVNCDGLMLDSNSKSDTLPVNDIQTNDVEFSHEAKVGKISEQAIFYLMSRGLSEDDAKAMIVRGFANPVSKELPLEYAVEMNRLINLELEGAIG